MIALAAPTRGRRLTAPLSRRIWMLAPPDTPSRLRYSLAVLVSPEEEPPQGFGLYVQPSGLQTAGLPGDVIALSEQMAYVGVGDILRVSEDGRRVRALWRASSRQNSLMLTERCDHYCLMCSQPPKMRVDDYLLDDAFEVVRLLEGGSNALCFTGGEPTLYGGRFIELLHHCRRSIPAAAIHILSNGRRFADPAFSDSYAEVGNPEMMVGIPLYGAEGATHNYVVQAEDAFEETVRGVCRLGERDQRIEIRIVVHRQTVPVLVETAEFIARNLPFVEQVALMGLEMMGLARANMDTVWMDPFDYREELAEATLLLHEAGLRTLVYNHQLCVIDREVWPFAVRSISDWKNDYYPECERCGVRDRCGGFFASAEYRRSTHIRPIELAG
jgi:His-Xaa-Ser system radical SAM maturase HxsC